MVAAYNAGPGRVARSGELSLSGETAAYVQRVRRHGGLAVQ